MYKVVLEKQAKKYLIKIKQAGLLDKVKNLFSILQEDPFKYPPRYEALVDNLKGFYSRRINLQHRMVYKVEGKYVKVIRLWTHYENFK